MEVRVARETDWNALMRAILLIALTAFLARLIMTGNITGYIHPKFIWFTGSAGIGFLLMAGGQLAKALRGTTVSGPMRTQLYLTMTAVICVGFVMRPHTFASDLAAKQGLNLTNRSIQKGQALGQAVVPAQAQPAPIAPPVATPGQTTPPPAVTPPVAGTPQPAAAPPVSSTPTYGKGELQLVNDTAVITPQNFARWMVEIYDNHVQYEGKRVVYEGFTFFPPESDPAEFAVVRLVVTCHVAHASPDGLLSINPGKARPAQDTWNRVEGVLEPVMFKGQSTVRLRIEKMTPIAKPDDPYVYG